MNNFNNTLIQVPDQHYRVWLDKSIKTVRIIKPKNVPVQVFRDLWHEKLDRDYIEKCIKQPLRRSNWVTRVVYYIFTSDGKEGFIPVPKYAPKAFQHNDRNPPIMFLYKVDNTGLYYFK